MGFATFLRSLADAVSQKSLLEELDALAGEESRVSARARCFPHSCWAAHGRRFRIPHAFNSPTPLTVSAAGVAECRARISQAFGGAAGLKRKERDHAMMSEAQFADVKASMTAIAALLKDAAASMAEMNEAAKAMAAAAAELAAAARRLKEVSERENAQ